MALNECSDSGESDVQESRTSVLLGLPDGAITSKSDVSKLRVSRIGGKPAFPFGTPAPPVKISHCNSCSSPMELLVQLWCPFENSPYDRALYVWGCARRRCQRKPGSVKAGRALRYNAQYAAKLTAKKSKREERQNVESSKPTSTVNPFSLGHLGNIGPQLFTGGFDDASPPVSIPDEDDGGSSSGDPSSASEDEEQDDIVALSEQVSSTNLDGPAPDWNSVPSYTPFYLDTVWEYIAPSAQRRYPTKLAGGHEHDGQWGIEQYERMQGADDIFEKFTLRISEEPQQCVRYDLSGIPLPFSTESVYKSLFPLGGSLSPAPGDHTIISGSGAVSTAGANGSSEKRVYRPSVIPACEACGGPRVFESQLMPNLINVIRAASNSTRKALTDKERRADLARTLKGPKTDATDETDWDAKEDMEWGTCMVFSCLSDCCRRRDLNGVWVDAKNCFLEEVVLVQWDS